MIKFINENYTKFADNVSKLVSLEFFISVMSTLLTKFAIYQYLSFKTLVQQFFKVKYMNYFKKSTKASFIHNSKNDLSISYFK